MRYIGIPRIKAIVTYRSTKSAMLEEVVKLAMNMPMRAVIAS